MSINLNAVAATAENAITARFSAAVYFSTLLDTKDASNPGLWTVTPVPNTVGWDGNTARSVLVVATALDATGENVTLLLDRPMTPYPAQYQITVSGVWSADRTQEISPTTLSTFGTYRQLVAPQQDTAAPARDFANPQTTQGTLSGNIAQPQQTPLGSFAYSDDHDYAIDQGDAAFHKRIYRRIFTRKGGFVFLPNYGVGATTYGKRLGRASVRDQLAAECESQISQEPEVAKVQAFVRPDPVKDGLYRLALFITKKNGRTSKFSTLVNPG